MADETKNMRELMRAVSQKLSVLAALSEKASGRTTAMLHRALVDSEKNPGTLVVVAAYRVSVLDFLKQRASAEACVRYPNSSVRMTAGGELGCELRVGNAGKVRARVVFIMLNGDGDTRLKGLPPHRLYIDHHEHETRIVGLLQELHDRASSCIEQCAPIASLKPVVPPDMPSGDVELKPSEGGRA